MAWILNLFLGLKNLYVDTVDIYADRIYIYTYFLPAVPTKFLIIIDSGLIFLYIKEKCQILSRRPCTWQGRKVEKLWSMAIASAVLPHFLLGLSLCLSVFMSLCKKKCF